MYDLTRLWSHDLCPLLDLDGWISASFTLTVQPLESLKQHRGLYERQCSHAQHLIAYYRVEISVVLGCDGLIAFAHTSGSPIPKEESVPEVNGLLGARTYSGLAIYMYYMVCRPLYRPRESAKRGPVSRDGQLRATVTAIAWHTGYPRLFGLGMHINDYYPFALPFSLFIACYPTSRSRQSVPVLSAHGLRRSGPQYYDTLIEAKVHLFFIAADQPIIAKSRHLSQPPVHHRILAQSPSSSRQMPEPIIAFISIDAAKA
ncbi:uncharacterized protein LACBIDRAFT_324554 [Laccaria bicolor S238N-H82]|uniref:Predicted protein n=1 Tax=Laccaria bicolor (strain S238N-H82 / ATCC MYA-4686) TaxID=486041 RepID=B0D299_LACBS|nr:uncharacterized protein LACBIDRAFT_324554 [Laccaria bicolor S238N-H82]EDR11066.1 predicted protein [Laccaria bicolor S238N-H82]|eukprot:XP_001878367.1 predicted protein [Laccaria bicolor S238N-H82]